MLKHPLLVALLMAATPVMAQDNEEYVPGSDQPEPAGFLTELLNKAIEKQMAGVQSQPQTDESSQSPLPCSPESTGAQMTGTDKQDDTKPSEEKMEYGRTVTKWVSAPKFGGYFIGSYKYSDRDGAHNGDGFNVRLVRMYVDGTILRDFNYRIQMEYSKTMHLKDFFIEYARFKEFRVKVGQFKRAFTFENPYNPFDVGLGDYAQVTKRLSGFSDYVGAEYNGSNGGRDLGLQLQGDLFPMRDGHRLIHYQAAVFNGQGINTADANGKKDWMGTQQIVPVKNLYIGVFGWKGTYKANGVTAERNRYAVGLKYETSQWTARAEYAHHVGYKISDYALDGNGRQQLVEGHSNGRADGWYMAVGAPCTKWLKVYVKYDAYRETASNNSLKSIYSICPNIDLHKNLKFQVQYNYVHDKTVADRNYNEIWAQAYVRF